MTIEKLLSQHKSAVLKRWFDSVLETYPPETTALWKKEKDPFANPVGHTAQYALAGIFDELLKDGDVDHSKLTHFVDRIIRIRAIQDFAPSNAVRIIFHLKTLIREELAEESDENKASADDLTAFESKIDQLGLLAFDVYMACREKLYDIRLNEIKNRTQRLLQRANLLAEIPEFAEGGV
jgi:hypothetical protein